MLIESGINYVEVANEAAFYGPKIDVQVWSAIRASRSCWWFSWTISSVRATVGASKLNLHYRGVKLRPGIYHGCRAGLMRIRTGAANGLRAICAKSGNGWTDGVA